MLRRKTVMTSLLAASLAGACMINSLQANDNPVELGKVRWNRNLEAALKTSKKTGKPVFAFFQEVPG